MTTSGRTPERTGAHLQNASSSLCQGPLEPPLTHRYPELGCYRGHPGTLLCSTHPPSKAPPWVLEL